MPDQPSVEFRTAPESYRHWRLVTEGPVATLTMDVDEQGGIVPGYELKLNSYDLGVDIELYDVVQRLRFEHPEVRAVIMTSGKEKVFCAGANIRMLASSPHAWKVNFCKFTNETRNGIEDASENSGQTYLAACNGTASGGGYELALACDHIMLIDDRSSAVALPELPLLGVLPGTGGLTRVTDKRHVRRDLADYFATKSEGIGGRKAVQWRLVDEAVPRAAWTQKVAERAAELAGRSTRPADAEGIELTPLPKTRTDTEITYRYVTARLDRDGGVVEITASGPETKAPPDIGQVHEQGADFWTLALTRELDDLILDLRTNELELGTWVLRTRGDPAEGPRLRPAAARPCRRLAGQRDHPLPQADPQAPRRDQPQPPRADRAGQLLRRVPAGAGPGRGPLLPAGRRLRGRPADARSDSAATAATVTVGPMNLGPLPMGNGLTRLQTRYLGDDEGLAEVEKHAGEPLTAEEAEQMGLVTFAPDDIDWDDEIRIAVEERASFSPDALSGLEANYRFAGPETMETKIFGRLTAWQNWIFNRPNASGPEGALRRFGTGQRAVFDRKRV